MLIYNKLFIRKESDAEKVIVEKQKFGLVKTLKAWSVYGLIIFFILISSKIVPSINELLNTTLVTKFDLPVTGNAFKFGWLSNAGLMIFLGAMIGGFIQGMSFGKLQATAASDLGLMNQGTFFGVTGSESNWLAAANCAGSEGGKLISPQSIAIATAACDMEGQDGEIMRKTIPFAIFWILMNGLMVFLGLHVI